MAFTENDKAALQSKRDELVIEHGVIDTKQRQIRKAIKAMDMVIDNVDIDGHQMTPARRTALKDALTDNADNLLE